MARALALSIMEQDDVADSNQRGTSTSSNTQRTTTVGGRDSQASGNNKCSLS